MKNEKTAAGFVEDEPVEESKTEGTEPKIPEVKKIDEDESIEMPKIDEATKKKNDAQKKKDIREYHKRKLVQLENQYTEEQFRGEYYVERCNMMAEQIESGEITERIDDKIKTRGLMLAEYKMMRRHAIIHIRNAHFKKLEIMEDYHLKEEDIQAIENSFCEGKIIREAYDEKYNPRKGAGFVPTPDDSEE